MLKYFTISLTLALLGLVAGSLIVWFAVSTWTTLSTHWLHSALVMPTLGLIGGLALSDGKIGDSRGRLRGLLALVACPLCGFANYLAFVITSRTWFADQIPLDHQSLIGQLLNPDWLPAFSSRSSTYSSGSAETWLMSLVVGLVAGPVLVFWTTSRKG